MCECYSTKYIWITVNFLVSLSAQCPRTHTYIVSGEFIALNPFTRKCWKTHSTCRIHYIYIIPAAVSCWASKCNGLIQPGLALASALNVLPKYIHKLTQIHSMRLKLNCHSVQSARDDSCILYTILSIIPSNWVMLAFTISFIKLTNVCITNCFWIEAKHTTNSIT